MSESFWKGAFAPMRKGNEFPGHSGNPKITIGEPEEGLVDVYVEWDHTCHWAESGKTQKPPSNGKTYTYTFELESYISGEQEEAADLQLQADKAHEKGEAARWFHENIAPSILGDVRGVIS